MFLSIWGIDNYAFYTGVFGKGQVSDETTKQQQCLRLGVDRSPHGVGRGGNRQDIQHSDIVFALGLEGDSREQDFGCDVYDVCDR